MGKKKFAVVIDEICSESFEVLAENIDEAIKIGIKKYEDGEFVFDAGKIVAREISVQNYNEHKGAKTWLRKRF